MEYKYIVIGESLGPSSFVFLENEAELNAFFEELKEDQKLKSQSDILTDFPKGWHEWKSKIMVLTLGEIVVPTLNLKD